MWVVIDTNCLGTRELWGFLALSQDNRAVLPDYVIMERFKADDTANLHGAFGMLGDFPGQVIVLKGTGEVSQLDPADGDLKQAMINQDETDAVGDFCRQLEAARRGDPVVARQLNLRVGWAQAQMEVVLKGSAFLGAELKEFQAPFTPGELRELRRGAALSPAAAEKFFGLARAMAMTVIERAPFSIRLPQAGLRDHFVFRNALCTALYMLSLTRMGVEARKPDRARNDIIDVLLATYGTYFNGVMSDDKLTNSVQNLARHILAQHGVAVGADYLPDYMAEVVEFLERTNLGNGDPAASSD